MFCPLCNAEYREGFAECSDCNASLVATLDEAAGSRVSVWKGESERELDRVLDALASGGIRYHYHDGLSPVPKIKLSTVPVRPRFETEVWVLQDDRERAESAIRDLQSDSDEEEEDSDTATGKLFCPLCKAEYRPGFTECSDCHAALMTSRSRARDASVLSVWSGNSKRQLEDILSVLQAANIPLRFLEHMKVRPALDVAVFGVSLTKKQSNFDREFEVQILASDAGRARLALQQAQTSTES